MNMTRKVDILRQIQYLPTWYIKNIKFNIFFIDIVN